MLRPECSTGKGEEFGYHVWKCVCYIWLLVLSKDALRVILELIIKSCEGAACRAENQLVDKVIALRSAQPKLEAVPQVFGRFCGNETGKLRFCKRKIRGVSLTTFGCTIGFRHSPVCISSTIMITRSASLRTSLNPDRISFLNSSNFGLSIPPKMSMYSCGILKGAASKPTPPGEIPSMKPKSMSVGTRVDQPSTMPKAARYSRIRCPSLSTRMLPLCLSFSCKT